MSFRTPRLRPQAPGLWPQVSGLRTQDFFKAFLFAILLLLLPACGTAGRPVHLAASGEGPAVVVGDWDDVEAAVRVALSRHELTFARREGRLSDPVLVYIVHGVRDERGTLRVERSGDPGAGAVEITVACRLDPATGAARARAVERDVARRIEQLRGEVARPLAW
ncbi:MAG: hypothetical protein KIS87_11310 [Phycisphaeraceae bacterium]|nr:hypothetical protein [Phycisphaeraceae bacterium]